MHTELLRPLRVLRLILCLVAGMGGMACATSQEASVAESAQSTQQRVGGSSERMLIQTASMTVEVSDPVRTAAQAETLVASAGGYVGRSTTREQSVDLKLLVPEAELARLLNDFAALGKVTYRSVEAEDVTERIIDTEARVKNLVATRDRLRAQLDRAVTVQDVVAVEAELSRIQSELDALEAKLQYAKGRVALATVSLTFQRKRILGPFGYVSWALWWGVSKLFVIR